MSYIEETGNPSAPTIFLLLGGWAYGVGFSESAQITVALQSTSREVVGLAIISSAPVGEMFGNSWFGAEFWAATYRSNMPLNKYE